MAGLKQSYWGINAAVSEAISEAMKRPYDTAEGTAEWLRAKFPVGSRVVEEHNPARMGIVIDPMGSGHSNYMNNPDLFKSEGEPICIKWMDRRWASAYQYARLQPYTGPRSGAGSPSGSAPGSVTWSVGKAPISRPHTAYCSNVKCMCDELGWYEDQIAAAKSDIDLSRIRAGRARPNESIEWVDYLGEGGPRPFSFLGLEGVMESNIAKEDLHYQPQYCSVPGCQSTTGCMHPRKS
jgi:hypothetical protein